jgi:hypothetical protein
MSIRNVRVTVTGLLLAVLSTAPIQTASACSHNKLSLDYCGAESKPERKSEQPLYKPEFEKPSRKLPDTYPTVVAPRDSRGKPAYGPGFTTHY